MKHYCRHYTARYTALVVITRRVLLQTKKAAHFLSLSLLLYIYLYDEKAWEATTSDGYL